MARLLHSGTNWGFALANPPLPAESAPDGALFYFMVFYVYIIQSQKDGSYYKVYTENYYERLIQHNSGVNRMPF